MADKVQLIKEEIEKKRQLIWPTNTGEMKVVDTPNQLIQGWLNCLKWIEDFINSLPEEPASKDLKLEEEITRYYKSLGIIENAEETYEWDDMIANTILTARHFAEWQKQEDEKLFKEDSWNYIEEYYPDITKEEKLRLYDVSIKSRLAGANTIKQKMAKDVFIDDYIVHDGRIELEGDPLPSVDPIILLPYPNFKPNDKVKIIIVKEEQK